MRRKPRRVSLATHFERMSSRFDSLGFRFDAVDSRLESLDKRLGAVDTRLDAVDTRLNAVDRRFATVDFRFAELQKDMRSGFSKMDSRFDLVMSALDRMTGELLDNRQSHTLFGSMLGDHRRTLESHNLRLTSLESRVPPRTP